jgi:hypothetical protein
MKKLLTILSASICLTCGAMNRFEALSQLETGNNDFAHGSSSEVSRFQITLANWNLYAHGLDPANPFTALKVAQAIMRDRTSHFFKTHGRDPTDYEWAILFHCPSRLRHPNREEREYARRFENLCTKRN